MGRLLIAVIAAVVCAGAYVQLWLGHDEQRLRQLIDIEASDPAWDALVAQQHRSQNTRELEVTDSAELTRQIQAQLRRVGCYKGAIDGAWTEATQRAVARFRDRSGVHAQLDDPRTATLSVLARYVDRACGQSCPLGARPNETGDCQTLKVVAAAQPLPTWQTMTQPSQFGGQQQRSAMSSTMPSLLLFEVSEQHTAASAGSRDLRGVAPTAFAPVHQPASEVSDMPGTRPQMTVATAADTMPAGFPQGADGTSGRMSRDDAVTPPSPPLAQLTAPGNGVSTPPRPKHIALAVQKHHHAHGSQLASAVEFGRDKTVGIGFFNAAFGFGTGSTAPNGPLTIVLSRH